MDFFGIGVLELAFILVVALLVLGPNRMVDVARTLGKHVRELQRATSELPRLLTLEDDEPKAPPAQRPLTPGQPADEQQDPPSKV